LLRAVWMDDRETFDKVWNWTRTNLSRSGKDNLFSWKWGAVQGGTFAKLDEKAATDADQDIAGALLIAGKKWSNEEFTKEAGKIIDDIWKLDVVRIKGQPYLTAGPWASSLKNPRLNPSYFAPYWYRVFSSVDKAPDHDWQGLVNTCYSVLGQVSALSLVKLPADWCNIDGTTGEVTIESEDKASDYSYDAMRVPWRVALDLQLNNEPRAKEALERMIFLRENWRVNHKIQASYTAYGVTRSFEEPLVTFGCALPMFAILQPEMAQQILKERIYSVYKDGLFIPESDYYNNNWAWFGLASYANKIKL
jgi:endoglucanase